MLTLVQCVGLEIDESNLTGENKPRRKIADAIATTSFAELSINERENVAFMGTLVRNGKRNRKEKERKVQLIILKKKKRSR